MPDGGLATLCIRERGIELLPARGGRNEPGLAGRVRHVKFLGDVSRVEVVAEGFEVPLQVRLSGPHPFTKGSEVRIQIDPQRVLIFAAGEDENP